MRKLVKYLKRKITMYQKRLAEYAMVLPVEELMS